MAFRDSLNNTLVKWGTKEPTNDIREALPPGTQIGEYVPNPKGQSLVRPS